MTSIPEDWPSADPAHVMRAKKVVLEALIFARLADYFDVDGPYAGATFATIQPNDPSDVTGADLHALQMLSVSVGPAATRRVLDHGTLRANLLDALARVPANVSLRDATSSHLSAAWEFYGACRDALRNPRASYSDPWVTATKLAARKRPLLVPVRDTITRRALECEKLRDGRIDWQIYRALLQSEEVLDAIDSAQARLLDLSEGRSVQVDDNPLRVIDVALWMVHVRK